MSIPPWKTASGIVKRVSQLSSLTLTNDISPAPLGGRTFMCLPQNIRFNIYNLLLSSSEPIKRPWPNRKFTMQLMRVSKDVFAEATYCFYGKGDDGRDLDDEIDLLASHSGNETVYMTPSLPTVRANSFQPMMNFATQELDLPPFPYRALITHISISASIPWSLSTLDYLGHYANLNALTIIHHSRTSIFPYYSTHVKHYANDIFNQDTRNGNFIRNCVTTLNADGVEIIEVVVRQEILRRPKVTSNRAGAPLEEWYETPDELVRRLEWDVTVDERRALRLALRARRGGRPGRRG